MEVDNMMKMLMSTFNNLKEILKVWADSSEKGLYKELERKGRSFIVKFSSPKDGIECKRFLKCYFGKEAIITSDNGDLFCIHIFPTRNFKDEKDEEERPIFSGQKWFFRIFYFLKINRD